MGMKAMKAEAMKKAMKTMKAEATKKAMKKSMKAAACHRPATKMRQLINKENFAGLYEEFGAFLLEKKKHEGREHYLVMTPFGTMAV